MSTNRKFVVKECVRFFAAIPLLDSIEQEGKTQIVETLMRHCQSDEHVAEVLKFFSEHALNWKNPLAELVAIAHHTEKSETAPAGCEQCDRGEDRETGQQRWAAHVIVQRKCHGIGCPRPEDGSCGCPLLDVGARCSCRRGRWLAMKDAQRKAEDAEAPKPKKAPARFGEAS